MTVIHLFKWLAPIILIVTFNGLASGTGLNTDLLIVGGGASGTAAAIQASRMGIKTVVVDDTEWLGGMLTAAGVSAIDGNHNLPSGIWGEFRQKLYSHYGGPKALGTGWVSNTLFEPSVADKILKEMARNPNLTVLYKADWLSVTKTGNAWQTTVKYLGKETIIRSTLIIDATELGDVMAYLHIPYSVGMDSRDITGEAIAPKEPNNIIQDLTYVVTLKDYGKNADKTITRPANYNEKDFECACDVSDPSKTATKPLVDCDKMLSYGKLPNNKYMINWPKCGNDFYVNLIGMDKRARAQALQKAKLHSLGFVYYIQTKLGYKNLGLADDEYPTADHLPMIAYYRESRRLKGKVTLTVNDLTDPLHQPNALYRTGIAVGDYPIDHHHAKNLAAPKLEFIKIKVPSYTIPLGALIPENTEGIIVAEKSISVTNIVAGTTRLQPVVLEIGQGAGALAAVAIKSNSPLARINIRSVQNELLNSGAYLLPFLDVKPAEAGFKEIQRVGATGILTGVGIAYQWSNQTWFYPQMPVSENDLIKGVKLLYPQAASVSASGKSADLAFCAGLFQVLLQRKVTADELSQYLITKGLPAAGAALSKKELAIIIDHFLSPFDRPVDFKGNFTASN